MGTALVECLLSGAKQTLVMETSMSANDPFRTLRAKALLSAGPARITHKTSTLANLSKAFEATWEVLRAGFLL
jgi:hypothetical protein